MFVQATLIFDLLFCFCFCFLTGPKVVSKVISLESIKELSDVIKRKPVIWDNIHANDYDQKRIFLGR